MEEEEIKSSWLLLGDGDFTYSLDCAEYLASLNCKEKVHLVCTGFDTKEDLRAKYKDIDSILSKLQSFNLDAKTNKKRFIDGTRPNVSMNKSVCVTIEHGIDALSLPASYRSKSFHRIIFNHPHLGIEDATLHHQFLCHFFHSLSSSLSFEEKTVVHMALVCSQFERWKCQEAANAFGFHILHKELFKHPIGINGRYETRRHQSGRSFGRRTFGSEMITFAKGMQVAKKDIQTQLPWQSRNDSSEEETSTFQCKLCNKNFREERSLKNHLLSLHSNERNTSTVIKCNECENRGISRLFKSTDALEQHRIAKHEGFFTNIKPDWLKKNILKQENVAPSRICPICKCSFVSEEDEVFHNVKFKPKNGDTNSITSTLSTFQCKFCLKQLRDERARQQHENYCLERKSTR